MTRTMTMTRKAMGAGRGAEMARSRADGTQMVRRVVGFAIIASVFVAIASHAFTQLPAH
ncbi:MULTISPECIES: hypothetical protein [unclassified Paraburkholderia]|uniref:hypothetical protein n=1 Tax=unclassified Paraburkholderia TaxID=2615204 RepID=UPI0019800D5F|nr:MULTISPECIES: hypothetical protein [unclassified Paraburkholderia]MBN3852676.1 hypothetical protein [Paraburkholderia sp. Ac-20340]